MGEKVKELISTQEINKKVDELARRIEKDYEGESLTLVCVLKGGVIFMTDLARRLTIPVEFDFMDISSYGDSTVSSGTIKINKDLSNTIEGKNVILIEDIIDTGRTLHALLEHLSARNPRSLSLCTLLDKPSRRVVSAIKPQYTGFVIPDEFVVGYGLDYAQRYRNLSYIGILEFSQE